MPLSKTIFLQLSTGSILEDRKSSRHDCKIVDSNVKNQHKYIYLLFLVLDLCEIQNGGTETM